MMTTQPTSAGSAASDPLTVPPFAVISGAQVQGVLQGREKEIVELVEATYPFACLESSIIIATRGFRC